MRNKTATILFLMVVASTFLLIFSGCGKKGPPLPPIVKGKKIATPADLKYTYSDKDIALTWQHKIDAETAAVKPDGFEIFMAKKTFEACEGCPFKFKVIGFVSMPSMKFVMDIEKGFKYYFRVQAVNDANMRSEYSKTVQFEYK
ncbi:MAG: hypothetical protein GY699_22720 [Desulfobacteraceae bacterium]|nr:hypothetical protein [Desulfobacteraceae bacterium]